MKTVKDNFKLKPLSVELKRLKWKDVMKKPFWKKNKLLRHCVSRICRQLLNFELKLKKMNRKPLCLKQNNESSTSESLGKMPSVESSFGRPTKLKEPPRKKLKYDSENWSNTLSTTSFNSKRLEPASPSTTSFNSKGLEAASPVRERSNSLSDKDKDSPKKSSITLVTKSGIKTIATKSIYLPKSKSFSQILSLTNGNGNHGSEKDNGNHKSENSNGNHKSENSNGNHKIEISPSSVKERSDPMLMVSTKPIKEEPGNISPSSHDGITTIKDIENENYVELLNINKNSEEIEKKSNNEKEVESSEQESVGVVDSGRESSSSSSSESETELENEVPPCFDPSKFLQCNIKTEASVERESEEEIPFVQSQNFQLNCEVRLWVFPLFSRHITNTFCYNNGISGISGFKLRRQIQHFKFMAKRLTPCYKYSATKKDGPGEQNDDDDYSPATVPFVDPFTHSLFASIIKKDRPRHKSSKRFVLRKLNQYYKANHPVPQNTAVRQRMLPQQPYVRPPMRPGFYVSNHMIPNRPQNFIPNGPILRPLKEGVAQRPYYFQPSFPFSGPPSTNNSPSISHRSSMSLHSSSNTNGPSMPSLHNINNANISYKPGDIVKSVSLGNHSVQKNLIPGNHSVQNNVIPGNHSVQNNVIPGNHSVQENVISNSNIILPPLAPGSNYILLPPGCQDAVIQVQNNSSGAVSTFFQNQNNPLQLQVPVIGPPLTSQPPPPQPMTSSNYFQNQSPMQFPQSSQSVISSQHPPPPPTQPKLSHSINTIVSQASPSDSYLVKASTEIPNSEGNLSIPNASGNLLCTTANSDNAPCITGDINRAVASSVNTIQPSISSLNPCPPPLKLGTSTLSWTGNTNSNLSLTQPPLLKKMVFSDHNVQSPHPVIDLEEESQRNSMTFSTDLCEPPDSNKEGCTLKRYDEYLPANSQEKLQKLVIEFDNRVAVNKIVNYMKIFLVYGFPAKSSSVLNALHQMIALKFCCEYHSFQYIKVNKILDQFVNSSFSLDLNYYPTKSLPIPSIMPAMMDNTQHFQPRNCSYEMFILKRFIFAIDKETREVLCPLPPSCIPKDNDFVEKITLVVLINPRKGLGPGMVIFPHSVLDRKLLHSLGSEGPLSENWVISAHQRGGLTQSMMSEFMNGEGKDWICRENLNSSELYFAVDWWWCLEKKNLDSAYQSCHEISLPQYFPNHQDPLDQCLGLTLNRLWYRLVHKWCSKSAFNTLQEHEFPKFIHTVLHEFCEPSRLMSWCQKGGLYPLDVYRSRSFAQSMRSSAF